MTKICISPGDPAGIGPEITLKALAKNRKIQKNGFENWTQNMEHAVCIYHLSKKS